MNGLHRSCMLLSACSHLGWLIYWVYSKPSQPSSLSADMNAIEYAYLIQCVCHFAGARALFGNPVVGDSC